ncbi:MAG: hypothetical protein ACRD1N_06670 [Terriglobia bacterium]
MLKARKILVALSDLDGKKALSAALRFAGVEPVFTSTLREAKDVLGREPVAVVFCQSELEDGNFRDILDSHEARRENVPVVVCAPFYDSKLYIDAMGCGAYDFIAYPYAHKEVDWILHGALRSAAAATA